MGVFDLVRAAFGLKSSATSPAVVGYFGTGQVVWTPDNYEALAREGYRKSVYVFRSVDMVAQSCAGVPLILQRTAADGTVTEIPAHPLLSLLRSPNPSQGGAQLMANWVAYRLLSGNSYLEAVCAADGVPSRRNPPKELYTNRPDRMQVKVGTAREPVQGYQYRVGGSTITIPADRILHTKTFNPLDDWYGMPPLVAASRSVDQNNLAKESNVAMLANGARPSGALFAPGALSDNQKKGLLDQIKTAWAGVKNTGKVLLFEQGMSWQQMALSPVDLDFVEGSKLSAEEITMTFGVPMVLLKPTDATFANMEEARRSFYQDTVLPLLDVLMSELNRWLVPFYGDDLRLWYDKDQIEALHEQRDAVYKRTVEAFGAGLLTVNEARDAIGYDDDPLIGALYSFQIEAFKRFGYMPDISSTVPVTQGAPKSVSPSEIKAAVTAAMIERRRKPYVTAIAKQIRQRFKAEKAAVLQAVADHPAHEAKAWALGTIKGQREEWLKVMQAAYLATGEDFGADELADLKASVSKAREKLTPEEIASIQALVSAHFGDVGPGRIDTLMGATESAVGDALDGMAPDATADGVAATISGTYDGFVTPANAGGSTRADGLALDFVTGGSNTGRAAGATTSGLPLLDEWVTTGDNRVRPTHQGAAGQTVPHGTAFTVGASKLLYPGDTSLGATSEAVACRCFVQFHANLR